MSVDEALASGHSLALSPAILANLLCYLAETTINKIDSHQNRPLWYSNFGCRFIFPHFSQKSPTFSLLQRSTFSWALNRGLITEPKKSSNTSSA
ncbi:hypothetical protein ACFX10_046622 [Malus domestica]